MPMPFNEFARQCNDKLSALGEPYDAPDELSEFYQDYLALVDVVGECDLILEKESGELKRRFRPCNPAAPRLG